MPYGLIFPLLLALWLVLAKKDALLKNWRLNRIIALVLILAVLALSYLDVPLFGLYWNIGGVLLLLFGIWLLLQLNLKNKLRTIIAAIIIGGLIFVDSSGLFWQLNQYFAYTNLLTIIICIIIAAASCGYKQSLAAAAIGVELGSLVWAMVGNGYMGLPFLNLFALITAGAWGIIVLTSYLRHRQLTKAQE